MYACVHACMQSAPHFPRYYLYSHTCMCVYTYMHINTHSYNSTRMHTMLLLIAHFHLCTHTCMYADRSRMPGVPTLHRRGDARPQALIMYSPVLPNGTVSMYTCSALTTGYQRLWVFIHVYLYVCIPVAFKLLLIKHECVCIQTSIHAHIHTCAPTLACRYIFRLLELR